MKCFFPLLANIISNYYNYIIIFTQEWRGGTSFLAGKTAGNTLRPFTSQFNREREGGNRFLCTYKKKPLLYYYYQKYLTEKCCPGGRHTWSPDGPPPISFFFLANGVKEENG
jgi:hypothetical protein